MKTIVTYNPFDMRRFDSLSLLDSVFADDDSIRFDTRIPAVDVRETDTAFVIEAELPGMTEKDVELKVERGTLVLAAREKEDVEGKKEDTKEKFLRRERFSWNFRRSFELPETANENQIQAAFKNGILVVEIQKKPVDEPKKITINAA